MAGPPAPFFYPMPTYVLDSTSGFDTQALIVRALLLRFLVDLTAGMSE